MQTIKVGLILVLTTITAFAQESDIQSERSESESIIAVADDVEACESTGRAGIIKCGREQLKAKGLDWVIPLLALSMIGYAAISGYRWFRRNYRPIRNNDSNQ